MATKNISLSEEAYKKMKRLKEEGESFSDVVKKVSESFSDVTRFSGAFPEIAESEDRLDKERKEFSTRDIQEVS